MSRRRSLAALMAWVAQSLAQGQDAPKPVLRVELDPKAGVIVGQAVRVNVSVLVPNYLTDAPGFPQFEIENAIVVLPEERAMNLTESIGGESYAGVLRSYVVYPQAAGWFQLPAAPIVIHYASEPPKSTSVTLLLPPLQFEASIPAAAAGLPYFLPTTRLTIEQKLDHSLKGMKAGDSIRRTITVTAAKTQPMIIPPVNWEAPDGLRVYPQDASTSTLTAGRNEFTAGQRVDRASYVVLQEGDYELPAVKVTWWDLTAGKVREAVAPAVKFHAEPNPSSVADLAPEPEPAAPAPEPKNPWWEVVRQQGLWILAAIGVASLVVVLGRRYFPHIRRWRNETAMRRSGSEQAYFDHLSRAIRSGDPSAAYAKLLQWIRRLDPSGDADSFAASAQDENMAREIDILASRLYSGSPSGGWSGERLLDLLQQYRRSLGREAVSMERSLPSLNPGPQQVHPFGLDSSSTR